MRTIDDLLGLWDQLSNVLINEDEEIETSFLNFERGTPRTEIWHWFESQNPVFSVGILMNEGKEALYQLEQQHTKTIRSPKSKKFRVYYREVVYRYKDFYAESVSNAVERAEQDLEVDSTDDWALSDYSDSGISEAVELDSNGNPINKGA